MGDKNIKDVCDRKDGKNNRYLTWIDSYGNAAEKVAADLGTNPENILGISALESGWGTGPFAKDGGNNFFGMHSPQPFENGRIQAAKNKKVWVSTFASYEDSVKAFAKNYGRVIRGIKDAGKFAKALQDAKLFGIYEDGTPVETYARDVANTSESFKVRLKCK